MASLIQTQLEANALLREHGLANLGWTFKFDSARSRGGQCNYTRRTISMSRYLVQLWPEDQVRQTLLHEVAHALTPGHHHDAVWLAKAQSIGFTRNTRTHNQPTVPRPWMQWCERHGKVGEVHRRHQNRACGICYREDGRMTAITYRRNVDTTAGVR